MSARFGRAAAFTAVLLALRALAAQPAKPPPPPAPAPAPAALILYDSSGTYGWIGAVHARNLASLLGHFPYTYTILPVENYTAGQLNNFTAAFYLGTVYDNPLPAAFRSDVMTSTKPLVWFGYNLWEVA